MPAAPAGPAPETLLAAARRGDPAAANDLLARYRPYLLVVAAAAPAGRLRPKADPADLVQDALLAAHRGLPGFRGRTEAELVAWLRGVLDSCRAKLARRYLGTRGRDARRERGLAAALAAGALLDPGTSPSGRAGRREQAVRVAAALDRLAPDHREVLLLRHVDGLTFPEVAERLGRTEAAATQLWARAVRRLRAELGGGGDGRGG